ncbi:MAG TPA: hypothetical protein VF432_10380 [Thermoanaerobaculia bacterium]
MTSPVRVRQWNRAEIALPVDNNPLAAETYRYNFRNASYDPLKDVKAIGSLILGHGRETLSQRVRQTIERLATRLFSGNPTPTRSNLERGVVRITLNEVHLQHELYDEQPASGVLVNRTFL